jgi:hypothetical protein
VCMIGGGKGKPGVELQGRGEDVKETDSWLACLYCSVRWVMLMPE